MVMTTGITRFSYRIYHLLRQGVRRSSGKIANTMVVGAGGSWQHDYPRIKIKQTFE